MRTPPPQKWSKAYERCDFSSEQSTDTKFHKNCAKNSTTTDVFHIYRKNYMTADASPINKNILNFIEQVFPLIVIHLKKHFFHRNLSICLSEVYNIGIENV